MPKKIKPLRVPINHERAMQIIRAVVSERFVEEMKGWGVEVKSSFNVQRYNHPLLSFALTYKMGGNEYVVTALFIDGKDYRMRVGDRVLEERFQLADQVQNLLRNDMYHVIVTRLSEQAA